MTNQEYIVRSAKQSEFKEIGVLMVNVYLNLEGFTNLKQP